ncbi:hypothetical protein GOBAR_AA27917 [Gossypium barbadense]|uniref:Senescence-associated protein n=1 Tax=Gossypium barbadense TaxID=3634 RepID=A0A2P5WNT3_GOSBA|nr:hypothetical protein GOBAR_AA27917 [Gossypium barbadense]
MHQGADAADALTHRRGRWLPMAPHHGMAHRTTGGQRDRFQMSETGTPFSAQRSRTSEAPRKLNKFPDHQQLGARTSTTAAAVVPCFPRRRHGFYPPLDGNYALRRHPRLVRRGRCTYDTCPWGPKAPTAGRQSGDGRGKTNLSHDGLNPAHVPYWWVNNPTLGEFCFTMIGRADIEGSKSNVAMNAWLPQASYPCGNFSDTSSFKFRRSKGSIGHAFTVRIRTGNQNQTSFYPFVPHEISVLVELILGHLRYLLTDVPPQPNSPPDNVFRPDRPAEAGLGSKKRGRAPPPIHGIILSRLVCRPGKAPEEAVPSPSPGRHAVTRSRCGSSSSSAPAADGFGTGTLVPSPQSQSFSREAVHLGDLIGHEYDRARTALGLPDFQGPPEAHRTPRDVSAQLGTVTRLPVHPASPVLLTKNGPLGALDSVARLNEAAAPSYLFKSFAPIPKSDERFARQYRCGPPPEFPLASPRSGIVHHLSGPDRHALTRTLLRRSRSVGGAPARDPANQLPCALRVFQPVDSQTCQTPWSVFQDGPNGEPAGRCPEHAGAEARRDGACWIPRSRRQHFHRRIKGPGLGHRHDPRRSTPRADRRTGSRHFTSDRGASPAPIRFPLDNFKHSLTLFSKSFSSFPHGTCSLSVSRPYLASDRIYHPIRAAFPNHPTRRQRLVVRQGLGTTRLSPSPVSLSRGLRPSPPLRTLLQTTIRTPMAPDSQAGIFPVRSPLLGESCITTDGHDDDVVEDSNLGQPLVVSAREANFRTRSNRVPRDRGWMGAMMRDTQADKTCPFLHFDSLAQFAPGVCSFCIEEVDLHISPHPMGKGTKRQAALRRGGGKRRRCTRTTSDVVYNAFTGRSARQVSTMILPQWTSRDVTGSDCPRHRNLNTSPDHSIDRSDGRCVQRAGTWST